MATLDTTGLDRLMERYRKIGRPEADIPRLMFAWTKIIDDDNRRGILAGLDKDGNPTVPVKYRPKPPSSKPTKAQKNNPKKGARRGEFAGFGVHPAGLNNNLTSAEYRQLAGPPLAPRGAFSRVITNLGFTWGDTVPGLVWELVGSWNEVVNVKGERFLGYLFDGKGRRGAIPKRDLRGVRPTGMAKLKSSLRAWLADIVRSA